MEKRPRIKLIPTAFDKKIEILGIIFLIILWVLSIFVYYNLPNTIPTHFNLAGKADAMGRKQTVVLIAGVATLLYIGLSYLSKVPHLFNYPVAINTNNAESQYRIASRMLRLLRISVVAVFCLVLAFIFAKVKGYENAGIGWFIPLVVLLMFIPTIWGIRQAILHK